MQFHFLFVYHTNETYSHILSCSVSFTQTYTQITVVDFTFKVVFIWGGRYNNIGQYITGATIVPTNIRVLWGYNFEASVKIPDVVNGTHLSLFSEFLWFLFESERAFSLLREMCGVGN
jgi:hypothetical protein